MSGIRQSEPTSDLMLAISQGKVQNTTHVNKSGRNTDFNSVLEDVWDGGGIWVPPTQARIHYLASTDSKDENGGLGDGASDVTIFGLTDWDSLETSETVVMKGLAPVATQNAYVIIHFMVVTLSGNTAPNLGTITATADVDGTVTAQINPLVGRTKMAIHGWPSIQTAYGTRFYTTVHESVSRSVDLSVAIQVMDGKVPHPISAGEAAANSDGLSVLQFKPEPYNVFPGPAILKIQCQSSGNNTDVSAGFDLILCRNK